MVLLNIIENCHTPGQIELVNMKKSNINKVFQSIRLNNIKEFNNLIEKVDIDSQDEDMQNFLHQASVENNIEIARILIQNGININHQEINGKTSLHFCAEFQSILVAEEILSLNYANIDLKDNFGNTPLWTAVFNARGNYNLVNLFVKHKANAMSINKAGRSPIDFAIQIKDELLINILTKNR